MYAASKTGPSGSCLRTCAEMLLRSACAAAGDTPAFSLPMILKLCESCEAITCGGTSGYTGTQSCTRGLGYENQAGRKPMTVYGLESSRTVCPMMAGLPPKRRFQNPQVSKVVSFAPYLSSSDVKSRP